jgi:hypothetical protein
VSVALSGVFSAAVQIHCFSLLQGVALMLVAGRAPGRTAPAESRPAPRAVSVLVPCFNERKVLRRTLDSILRSEGVEIANVVCVDDGSTDGTAEVMLAARRHHGERVTVLRQENAGKAAALNHGLTAVGTSVFVCIDADTQVTPHAIARLLPHLADEDVAAVSGQMLVGNASPRSRPVHVAQQREYELANNIDRRAFSRHGCVTVVPGAIGAFRLDAVRAVGGYPPDTLAEDAHLTCKLLMRGHRVVHEPSAVVLTEAPDTLSGLFRQRRRWATGKIQLVLRTRREALDGPRRTRLLWTHMAVTHAVLPLLKVLSPVGLVAVPAYLALSVAHGATAPLGPAAYAVLGVTGAVALAQLAYSLVVPASARTADQPGRAAVGLAHGRPGPVSLALIPVVTCAATWVAWVTILSGRDRAWDKLDRSGDVQLTPEHAEVCRRDSV